PSPQSGPPGYTREVFAYPRFGRPDPVLPPSNVQLYQSAFPNVTVTGILYDAETPSKSKAILRIGSGATERRVVRAGDNVEHYHVVSIERSRVIFDVQLVGYTQRVYLEKPPTKKTNQATTSP